MKLDRFDKFVAIGLCAHALLFILGYIFVGMEYTILLFIIYGLTWITYCGVVAEKWDNAGGLYDDNVSVPALALVGGPLCWLLCPTCLLPAVQRKASGFTMLWYMAQRISQEIRRSLLKTMGLMHGFCQKEFPAAQGDAESDSDAGK